MVSWDFDLLTLAYRKAKADLYYANDPRTFDLLDYEKNLERNLNKLLDLLNGKDESWVDSDTFVGSYSIMPKSLGIDDKDNSKVVHSATYSSPLEQWHSDAAKHHAKFRLMSRCSIDMHVLSSLWIGLVGSYLENKLSDCALGNRLRRKVNDEFNWYSTGSFGPYLYRYRKWQDDGFTAMQQGLDENRRVTVLTADAQSYYHQLNPSFIGDQGFLRDVLQVSLDDSQIKLNRLMLRSIQSWQKVVGEEIGISVTGLPVGLSASAVIANLALIEFDKIITEELNPRYYGRYVDDIILVVDISKRLKTVKDVWNMLARRFDESDVKSVHCRLKVTDEGSEYCAQYLRDSTIKFINKKNKVFFLDPSTGNNLINSIRQTINERASEWRMMSSPLVVDQIGPRVARIRKADGDSAETLRSAEHTTASRSAFSLILRDMEALGRELPPSEWKDERRAFFSSVCDHILVPPKYFEMEQYTSRILALACSCSDWGALNRLVAVLVHTFKEVAKLECGSLKLAGIAEGASSAEEALAKVIREGWASHLYGQIVRAICISTDSPHAWSHDLDSLLRKLPINLVSKFPTSRELYEQLHLDLFEHDLALWPFRASLFPYEIRRLPIFGEKESPVQRVDYANVPVPGKLQAGLESLGTKLASAFQGFLSKEKVDLLKATLRRHPGLVYPTRPFSAAEIYAITNFLSANSDGTFVSVQVLKEWLFVTRGYSASVSEQVLVGPSCHAFLPQNCHTWVSSIPNSKSGERDKGCNPLECRIAVTMHQTPQAAIKRAMHGDTLYTAKRYWAFTEAVNHVLAMKDRPDYVVFGEMAVPVPWFFVAAAKLAARGISLISGVDYLRSPERSVVRNQVWFSLVTDAFGFRSYVIYRQDKQNPAHEERRNLADEQALTLEPDVPWDLPPIIHHGEYWFSAIVCSELTNVIYRSSLRGVIDMLFVPEWNKDTNTFESLVESAALDLHTYVVQINNRLYGDSRVRVPKGEKKWERDAVRLHGGAENYIVPVVLDIGALREFQSQYSSASRDYKPVPDGFQINPYRRT